MPMVFLAIDTLLTFIIICTMLWSGWIATLTTFESYLWYAATTLNLISLSLVVLYNEIRSFSNTRFTSGGVHSPDIPDSNCNRHHCRSRCIGKSRISLPITSCSGCPNILFLKLRQRLL